MASQSSSMIRPSIDTFINTRASTPKEGKHPGNTSDAAGGISPFVAHVAYEVEAQRAMRAVEVERAAATSLVSQTRILQSESTKKQKLATAQVAEFVNPYAITSKPFHLTTGTASGIGAIPSGPVSAIAVTALSTKRESPARPASSVQEQKALRGLEQPLTRSMPLAQFAGKAFAGLTAAASIIHSSSSRPQSPGLVSRPSSKSSAADRPPSSRLPGPGRKFASQQRVDVIAAMAAQSATQFGTTRPQSLHLKGSEGQMTPVERPRGDAVGLGEGQLTIRGADADEPGAVVFQPRLDSHAANEPTEESTASPTVMPTAEVNGYLLSPATYRNRYLNKAPMSIIEARRHRRLMGIPLAHTEELRAEQQASELRREAYDRSTSPTDRREWHLPANGGSLDANSPIDSARDNSQCIPALLGDANQTLDSYGMVGTQNTAELSRAQSVLAMRSRPASRLNTVRYTSSATDEVARTQSWTPFRDMCKTIQADRSRRLKEVDGRRDQDAQLCELQFIATKRSKSFWRRNPNPTAAMKKFQRMVLMSEVPKRSDGTAFFGSGGSSSHNQEQTAASHTMGRYKDYHSQITGRQYPSYAPTLSEATRAAGSTDHSDGNETAPLHLQSNRYLGGPPLARGVSPALAPKTAFTRSASPSSPSRGIQSPSPADNRPLHLRTNTNSPGFGGSLPPSLVSPSYLSNARKIQKAKAIKLVAPEEADSFFLTNTGMFRKV